MVAINVFEAVRNTVTARQVADFYHISVNRSGMACCPFHADKHPSMKIDRRFHCFGCQADGDAIDFVSQLFGLQKKEAAEKIANDFGINYGNDKVKIVMQRVIPKQLPEKEYQEAKNRCYRVYCDYLHLLQQWKVCYAPKIQDTKWDERFVEACQMQSYVEYVLDEIFISGTVHECVAFITTCWKEVLKLEKRISGIVTGGAGEDTDGSAGTGEESIDQETKPDNSFHGGIV